MIMSYTCHRKTYRVLSLNGKMDFPCVLGVFGEDQLRREKEREETDVDVMFGPKPYRSFTPKTNNVGETYTWGKPISFYLNL